MKFGLVIFLGVFKDWIKYYIVKCLVVYGLKKGFLGGGYIVRLGCDGENFYIRLIIR